MAIKNRQGKSQDFVPTKLVSGEFAVVQEGDENTADGSALYLATKAGSVKRIPFATEVEDLKTQVEEVVDDAKEAIASAIDPTLTQSGKAADAKKTGDEINNINERIGDLSDLETENKTDIVSAINEAAKSGITDAVKEALLACFEHVAWIDEHGTDYYNALAAALGAEILTVTYNPMNRTIYSDDTLDSIKYFLSVKLGENTVARSDYTLTGTLTPGNSILTVTHNNKSVDVKIPVEEIKWRLTYTGGDLVRFDGGANKYATDSSGYGGATLNASAINRTFYANKGRHPFYLDGGSFQLDKFPIPVPAGATSVTITPTPNTYYTAIYCMEYHPDRISWQPYTVLGSEVLFGQGARTLKLPQAETSFGMRIVNMNIRITSSGSAYTDATNPTECIVQFS